MRAYTHRFISFSIQCAVIILLAFGLSFSAGRSLAQDVATDTPIPSDTATVTPTDVPTELPTVVPTDVPTEQPTNVPTEVVTDVPTEATTEQPTAAPTDATVTAEATDANVTSEPTEAVTQPPATPDTSNIFTEDFQDGETTGWLLTAGWTIVDDAGNLVLTANTPNEIATLTATTWSYFTLSFRVRGSIQMTMSSGGSNYQVTVAADGAASLYKDGVLLAQAAGEIPTDATVEPGTNWHTVSLLAPGNLLAIKVDNFTPISTSDPTLVGMGPIMLSTTADNTSSVAFDDLSIQRLDAPPPVPTAIPTVSGVVPIPPPMNVTAEPTVDVTTEATVEATVEATSEATVEATTEATAEATAEATVEATAEATIEATAEATVEPLSLSEVGRNKLPPALVNILDTYLAGDTAGAQAAAADYFITIDNQQRISLTVWTTDEQAAAKVAGDITASGDIITEAFSIRLQASVTLDGLLALANAPEVTLLEVQPKAVSTSDMEAIAPTGFGTGSEISEGVDTTGATAWQSAGIKGAGVGIAVIDTGFGFGVTVAGEYACLNSPPTVLNQGATGSDTVHGLYMVQVLCDMAPASKVYMYKAVDASTLKDAITAAKNNTAVKVIVIAMDLGASVTPGDGTDGGVTYGLNGLYTTISAARAAGKIVIASAGNNTGRYVTLNYTNITTTVPMTVFAGDTIHVSWNDWASSSQNLILSIAGTGITAINFSVGGPAAPTPRGGAPRATTTIPAGNCPAPTGCNINLSISGGSAALIVQVQVAGEGTLNAGGVTGASVASTAGNLARPADSPDVIAVGAVCNNSDVLQVPGNLNALPVGTIRLKRDTFSSQGPIFGTLGALPSTSASYTRDQVKPDLMGISHVSVYGNTVNLQNPSTCADQTSGFNGTSAAAANVAGMAALLLSTNKTNTSMAKFNVNDTTSVVVDEVQNYLQTHTIDDTTTAGTMVGYDMLYGAGLTILGSPTYNLNLVTTPTTLANQLPASCAATTPLYVGLANAGSAQDGTITNPFVSISEAMSKATSAQCIVVLPGEYVAPVAASASINAAGVLSYESATSFPATPSSLWSVFIPPISIASNDIIVDGFTAQTSATLNYPSGTSILHNPPLYINAADNAVVQNNSFTGYSAPGSLSTSIGTQIKGNAFTAFNIPTTTSNTIISPVFSTAVLTITNSLSIGLANNNFTSNVIGTTNGTVNPWQPALVGIRNSGVDVFNNRFTLNTASALVGIDSWQGTPGTGVRQAAEIRVFGNLFNTNTINGPLVHLFASQNMRFVNNTVVNNLMNGTSNYDGFFMYGVSDSVFGNMGGSAVEIHNNLFYNNGAVNKGLLDTVNQNAFENVGCGSIAVPGGGVPLRNNWFSPTIGPSLSSGACTDSDATDNTGKIQNTITEAITAASFFGAVTDPVDPYRLRPTDPSITNLKSGINTGDNQALIDMFGDPAYLSQFDLRGAGRVVVGGNPNSAYNTLLAVDIGAYELGTPSAPTADAVTKTIAEDSATSVIFTLTATGGYTQVFTITSQPSEYDTDPTNACGGQPVLFTAPKTVTYCPPANFHTQYGAGNTNVPLTIGFSVEDPIFKPGQISTNDISLTITPVNDGTPVVPTINVLSDYFTPIAQQLSPAYQLSNFTLTGTVPSVDYPFTYAYGSQTGTDNANLLQASPSDPTTVAVLQAAFTAANTNGGRLLLNPVAGQQGYFSFTYTVTDRDGNQGTGNATIVILPTLAKEGIYDDASFNFGYNGTGWAPSFVTGAYNNTLHASSAISDSIEFPFTGSTVRFNMRGTNNASSTLKLAFKTNIGGGGVNYNNYSATKTAIDNYYMSISDTTRFICTDSLNGTNPTSSPIVPPTDPTGSDVSNYSATGAAYTIICSGFPTGQVHSIRLTNNLAAAMTLDGAEVSAGIMTAGKTYQETSANLNYVSGWSKATNASMLGGGWAYTNVSDATFTFNIDSSVGRIIFYRATYAAASGLYGSMKVFLDGNLSTPIATISNTNATTGFLFGQPYLLTIASPGNHTITVKNVGTKYSDIDQIATLPVAQTLGTGTYQESYPDLTYSGVWTTGANASMLGGGWAYTNDANASVTFKIDSSVSRIIVYRTTYLAGVYGSMNVYLDGNLTTPIATISNTNTTSGLLYQQPLLFTIATPGSHTVTLKNVGATYSNIDQISLLGATQRLTQGVYQETDANLTYSGLWNPVTNASMLGGGWSYTNDPNASVSFKIDSTVSRIIVYRVTYIAGVYGTMNVYLDGDLTTPIATINNTNTTSGLLYQQPFLISIPVTGNHTVTLKNVGSTYTDIDQISLLGPADNLAPGTYQETDFNLTYSGNWLPQTLSTALGGSRNYTNQNGATVSFKIDNTVSRVIIYRSTYIAGVYGSMKVYLDTDLTNEIATINNTSSTFLLGQPFLINIGSLGNHTITLKNVGATYSDIDQITLLTSSTKLSAGTTGNTYQENYTDLTYTGTWSSQALTSALGGSRKYTNQLNASVSFDIDNTVSRVIIYRTTYPGGLYGPMQVLIDGSPAPESPIINTNTTTGFLFGQPFVVSIASPGNHTITLKNTNTNASYVDLDQITVLPVPATLAVGTYQDTDVNLTYNGTWTKQIISSALGGSRTYTNQDQANVTFKIDGSVGRMVIYRTTYPGTLYGPMEVLIDGSPAPESPIINTNTTTGFLFGQPFLVTIASPGTHTIVLRNSGATYSDLDQITLLPVASALAVGTYQETDLNLTYNGAWASQTISSALGGSRIYTNQDQANVTFKIDGSVGRMVIYRTTYPGTLYGPMEVLIDGSPASESPIINTNTSTGFLFGQPFLVTIASPGTHTIVLRNSGTTYSDLDQITLLPPAVTLTPGIYQDTDTNLTYTGIWTTQTITSALGGSRTYTNQNGAAVKFDIDSTVTRMVIYRSTYLASVYGTMNVYIDTNPTPIAVISNTSTTFLFGQPFFVNIPGSPSTHTITIKNTAATYIDIDQITLLTDAPKLTTAGLYEESDPAFNFTGAWTSVKGSGPSSGAAYYTYAQNATISFTITGGASGSAFAIYRTLVPGAGTFTVSIDGGAAQSFSDNFTSVLWQQPLEFTVSSGDHTVVITKTSTSASFIYFDAIRFIDPAAPLTVGQYQNTYSGLHYTGAWSVSGASTTTTTGGNTLKFKFTGNGFGFVTLNPNINGTMSVSCIISGGSNVCANPTSTPANGGYAFYNLKQGTYDVTITYTGSGGLFIDRVFVLDTPTTILQPGTYEDSNPGIVYSPSDSWTTLSSTAYSGGTSRLTSQKGAVMQVRFNGNSITLYQLAYGGGTPNLNLCVFLTDAAGNPTSVCTTYSQNTTTTNFIAPVAFYGFGTGTHEVVIENRTQGLQFAVDKILVN